MELVHVKEGLRIFLSSTKHRFKPNRYEGNAKEVCQQIVDKCWNGHYFQTSLTNFPQFWTRDFGWCCKSLLSLGYRKQVQQTIRYALNRFKQQNQITTTLTPRGKPFDFPYPAVDSLPYLIHSIKISRFPYQQYKKFLNHHLKEFFEDFIDPLTGLVKPNKRVSSMKDYAIRKSSCYDNCMVAMLAKDLKTMKLLNPFKKFNYSKLIKHHFWNGDFFYDDLTKKNYVAGDANIFPFALGIIQDEEMLVKVIKQIHQAILDQPLPLKYANKEANIKQIWQTLLTTGYETDACWTHMGPLYIQLLKTINPKLAQEHKKSYTKMIETYGNYLEVLTPENKPFKTLFYYSATDMLWAANYLTL